MGLGNIGITESYPEVSKEEMQSKLDVLKERFLTNYNPNLNERIDKIKRVQKLVAENTDSFHKALQEDFGTRHEQLSLLADTLPVINNGNDVLKHISKWIKPEKRKPNFPL
jgi:coniferyl-aldehyde dehydrogenase